MTEKSPLIEFIIPSRPEQLEMLREVFNDYAQSLQIDLGWQDFDTELETLPGDYASPRGAVLMALVDGALAGCCAVRAMDTTDYVNACEMKRLYVRDAFRGMGLGRQLAEQIMDLSRQAGYSCILLDTLDEMQSARELYQDLGFEEIPPYYFNPIPGAHYLKAML